MSARSGYGLIGILFAACVLLFGPLWPFSPLIAMLCLLIIVQFFASRRPLPPKGFESFPTCEQQFAGRARLTILQDRWITGRDHGWVWIQDGALFFAGARCSFVIGGGDLILPARHPVSLELPQSNTGTSVEAFTTCREREIWLQFTLVDTDAVQEARRLKGGLAYIRGSESLWNTMLPPVALGEKTKPRRHDAAIAVAGIAAAGMVGLLLFFGLRDHKLLIPVLLFVVFLGHLLRGILPLIRRRRLLLKISNEPR